MLKISTLSLIALLTLGAATMSATTANAAVNCSASPTACPPPPPPPPPPGDDTPPEYVPPPPPPPGGKIVVEYRLALDCAVKDDEPISDDFFLLNIGSKELPAGLKIRYEIPGTGERGAFLLPRSLSAGQKAEITGLLDAVASDSECRAMVIT